MVSENLNNESYCQECGKEITISSGPGRFKTYRGNVEFKMPDNLSFPICLNCGAEWLTDSQLNILSESFEEQRKNKKKN